MYAIFIQTSKGLSWAANTDSDDIDKAESELTAAQREEADALFVLPVTAFRHYD